MFRSVFIFSIMCAFAMSSCSKGDMSIGLNFGGTESLNGHIMDSLRIDSYVVKTDSLSSSSSGNIISGVLKYASDITLVSKSFFKISAPAVTYSSYSADLVLDSAKIIFNKSSYQGDTTARQTYYLHLLDEEIDESTVYYATSSLRHVEKPLGQITTRMWPAIDSSVVISFDKDLAEQIMAIYRENADNMAIKLARLIKGMVLKPDEKNTMLVYLLASSSSLKMYTHDSKSKEEFTIDFPVTTGTTQFNNFSFICGSRNLSNLKKGEELNTKEIENRVIIQSGNYLTTKIMIPGLFNLSETPVRSGLVKAELEIKSLRKSAGETPAPPSSLSLYTVNLSNQIEEILQTDLGESVESGYYYSSDNLVFDSFYKFDITRYVRQVINGNIINKGFVIIPADALSSLSSVQGGVFGNFQKENYQCQLKIYYTGIPK